MITLTGKTYSAGLDAQLDAFAVATGKAVHETVREQAAALIHTRATPGLMGLTPPFSGSLADLGSFAEQRRTGREAVARDIQRVFPTMTVEEMSIFKKPAKNPDYIARLRKAVEARDITAVTALMQTGKLRGTLVSAPTTALHNSTRGANGGTLRGHRSRYIVTNAAARNRFIREQQAKVGRAKRGWSPAARALGVSGLPAWINHGGEGSLTVLESGPESLRLRITNSVSYIAKVDQRARIIDKSIANRELAMDRQLRAKLEGLWNTRRNRPR